MIGWRDVVHVVGRALVDPAGDDLGTVAFDPGCVVEDDPGEIVRRARPTDDRDRAILHERRIAALRYDPAAVEARNRRLACSSGRQAEFRDRRRA